MATATSIEMAQTLDPAKRPFDPQCVRLASHAGRAFDHIASARLCVLTPPDDEVAKRYICTPPGAMRAISKDKDHSHSFVFRLLVRQDLPDLDPFASGEVHRFFIDLIKSRKLAPAGQTPGEVAERIVQALQSGHLSEEFQAVARAEGLDELGSGRANANQRKLLGLKLAVQADTQALDAAKEHLRHLRQSPFPDPGVPLRQRVKQLVLPGAQADCVVTPMPSLPLIDAITEIEGFVRQHAAYAVHRFRPWQEGVDKPQNTGVPGIGRARALHHPFVLHAQHRLNMAWLLRQEPCEVALRQLYTALQHRRVYREENGIPDTQPLSRVDIEEALSTAAARLAEAVDDLVDGLPEALRRESQPERARDQYLMAVAKRLQGLYEDLADQKLTRRKPQLGLRQRESQAVLAAWDALAHSPAGDPT